MAAIRRRSALVVCAGLAAALAAAFRAVAFAAASLAASASAASAAAACELVVVRHGETEWNRALRVQGSTDIELNGRGHAQAQRCAEALAEEMTARAQVPRAVYASELGRAAVTASAIAAALAALAGGRGSTEDAGAWPATQVLQDARLNEWDLGVLEGLTKDDAARLHPEDWALFSENWSSPRVSPELASRRVAGGESMQEVRQRAVACLEDVCRESLASGSSTAVAVTHGGVIGQLLQHAVENGEASDDVSRTPVNACISRFLVVPGGRWKILSWARTDHLGGDAAPVSANYNEQREGDAVQLPA